MSDGHDGGSPRWTGPGSEPKSGLAFNQVDEIPARAREPLVARIEKPGFNPVILALFSIAVMCGLYIGLNERAIPPYAAALGFLLWGAMPHSICLQQSIKHGHTEASVVLMLFLGFWLFLGIGLLVLPVHDLHAALRYAEPVIAIAVFLMVYYYRSKHSLAWILAGLGVTVGWLWLSKLIEAPPRIGSWVVGVLGFFVFIVANIQLNNHQADMRAFQRQVREEA